MRITIPRRKLRPYQRKMLKYALSSFHPAFIVKMRLGKTLVTIRYAKRAELDRCVVVAPIGAMLPWKTELNKEGETYIEAYSTTRKKRIEATEKLHKSERRIWYLINYESLRAMPEIAGVEAYTTSHGNKSFRKIQSDLKPDLVVLDEVHKIRNPRSQISKLCVYGFRNAKHRAFLTGTIRPENALDVVQPFLFLQGRFLDKFNYWDIRAKTSTLNDLTGEWTPTKEGTKLIREAVHAKAFILTDKDVNIKDRKIYTVRSVETTPEQKKLYKQVSKDFAYELSKEVEYISYCDEDPEAIYIGETIFATQKAIWLRRLACGLAPENNIVVSNRKNEDILELLKTELASEQVVIFYNFVDEIVNSEKFFKSNGIECEAIHNGGSSYKKINHKEREKIEEGFMKGNFQVLQIMQSIGAESKDLSMAKTIIYPSNAYSCLLRTQSEERIVNITHTHPLLIVDLITEGTVDEVVLTTLKDKVFDSKSFTVKFKNNFDAVFEKAGI